MTARRRAGRRPLAGLVFVLLGAALGVAVFWFFSPRPTPGPAPAPTPPPGPARTTRPSPSPSAARHDASPPSDFESAGRDGRGVLAIVLDDVGNPGPSLEGIGALEGPVALAVLPDSPRAAAAAALARRKKWDLLLHLPMQPTSGRGEPVSIGPSLSDREVVALTEGALEKLPGAIGINNHQGSLASADARIAAAVLGVVRDRGLFFLDSRTTASTAFPAVAARLGVSLVSRDIFLDDRATEEKAEGGPPEALAAAWERARKVAVAKGRCVAIGHPHPATLEFLSVRLPLLGGEGISLVKVSDLAD